MSENKNLPAFPFVADDRVVCEGLSKREYFAAMAMVGILADGGHEFRDVHKKRIAELSIVHADELLKQLELK